MDQVYIESLEVETLIGVYEFERYALQPLLLDIVCDYDCVPAGLSDQVDDALDYDRLVKLIRAWSKQQTFQLLEAYAQALVALMREEFSLKKVALTINKPRAIQGCHAVGIRIVREFV